jgi:hypothetical protein
VLLLVLAALTVIVVASATGAPAGAAPKKHGDKVDACTHIEEKNPDALPVWCTLLP